MKLHTRRFLAALMLVVATLSLGAVSPVFADKATSFMVKIDGREVALADLKGQVVYVDFWASWCGPCRKSFPWMNAMQEKYADQGFIVVGVNVDTESKLAEEFLRETPAQFPVVYDPDGKIAAAYGLVGMPSSFMVDHKGDIVARHVGFRDEDKSDYENEIRSLLRKAAIGG